ncbi:MAG: TPM domain-containing protein [Fimbriimonadaceae bacterium]
MRARGLVTFVALFAVAGAPAQKPLFPGKPEQGRFYLEKVEVLEADDALEIDKIGAQVFKDKGYPVMVVVVQSRQIMQAGHLTIEQYARLLFDNWRIGSGENNKGMLLLVSLEDREARIELGAAWKGSVDAEAEAVMRSRIIPNFKANDASEGLVEGARGLRDIAYRNSTYATPAYGGTNATGGPAKPPPTYTGGEFADVHAPASLVIVPFLLFAGIAIVIVVVSKLTGGGVFSSGGYHASSVFDSHNRPYLWNDPTSHHHSTSHSSSGSFGGGGGGTHGSGGGGGATGKW